MNDERKVLLHLLQQAYAVERRTQRLFSGIVASPPANADFEPFLTACSGQALKNQAQICVCIERIDGDASAPAQIAALREQLDVASDDAHERTDADMAHLYHEAIRLYESAAAAAESGGFFETKLACDKMLKHKSATMEWLLSGSLFREQVAGNRSPASKMT